MSEKRNDDSSKINPFSKDDFFEQDGGTSTSVEVSGAAAEGSPSADALSSLDFRSETISAPALAAFSDLPQGAQFYKLLCNIAGKPQADLVLDLLASLRSRGFNFKELGKVVNRFPDVPVTAHHKKLADDFRGIIDSKVASGSSVPQMSLPFIFTVCNLLQIIKKLRSEITGVELLGKVLKLSFKSVQVPIEFEISENTYTSPLVLSPKSEKALRSHFPNAKLPKFDFKNTYHLHVNVGYIPGELPKGDTQSLGFKSSIDSEKVRSLDNGVKFPLKSLPPFLVSEAFDNAVSSTPGARKILAYKRTEAGTLGPFFLPFLFGRLVENNSSRPILESVADTFKKTVVGMIQKALNDSSSYKTVVDEAMSHDGEVKKEILALTEFVGVSDTNAPSYQRILYSFFLSNLMSVKYFNFIHKRDIPVEGKAIEYQKALLEVQPNQSNLFASYDAFLSIVQKLARLSKGRDVATFPDAAYAFHSVPEVVGYSLKRELDQMLEMDAGKRLFIVDYKSFKDAKYDFAEENPKGAMLRRVVFDSDIGGENVIHLDTISDAVRQLQSLLPNNTSGDPKVFLIFGSIKQTHLRQIINGMLVKKVPLFAKIPLGVWGNSPDTYLFSCTTTTDPHGPYCGKTQINDVHCDGNAFQFWCRPLTTEEQKSPSVELQFVVSVMRAVLFRILEVLTCHTYFDNFPADSFKQSFPLMVRSLRALLPNREHVFKEAAQNQIENLMTLLEEEVYPKPTAKQAEKRSFSQVEGSNVMDV